MEFPSKIKSDAAEIIEQLGSKRKFWFKCGSDYYLFKEGRPGTGENWAEVVSADLCELIGIPHAEYGFSEYDGRPGVVTKLFVPKGARLVHGNELLERVFAGDYDPKLQYKQTQYTPRRVFALLRSGNVIKPPKGYQLIDGVDTALDVFIGYLMFDVLIANQDRHHENWGVIVDPKIVYLTPSFDHASSLGRNESDETRLRKMQTSDQRQNMKYYVEKASTPFYSSSDTSKRLSTMEAFLEGAKLQKGAALNWISQLQKLSTEDFLETFRRHSKHIDSQVAIAFAVKMLSLNRERLISCAEVLT